MGSVQETWYWDSSNVTEMVLSGVKCKGDEMTLTDCQHYSTVSCARAGAEFSAGVICSDSKSHHTESLVILSNVQKTQCGLVSSSTIPSGIRPGPECPIGGADGLHRGPAPAPAVLRGGGELSHPIGG